MIHIKQGLIIMVETTTDVLREKIRELELKLEKKK
jgi:hypothetical protein